MPPTLKQGNKTKKDFLIDYHEPRYFQINHYQLIVCHFGKHEDGTKRYDLHHDQTSLGRDCLGGTDKKKNLRMNKSTSPTPPHKFDPFQTIGKQ